MIKLYNNHDYCLELFVYFVITISLLSGTGELLSYLRGTIVRGIMSGGLLCGRNFVRGNLCPGIYQTYPTLNYTTLLYPTLHYRTLLYPTLPYPTPPYPNLPYPTLSYLTLPYPSLPYHTLPNPTLLYSTIRHPTLLYSTDEFYI